MEDNSQLTLVKTSTSFGIGFRPQRAEIIPTIVLGNQQPLPVAFWFRCKQKVLSHVKPPEPWEMDAAYSSPALCTDPERERRDLGGNAGAPRLGGPMPDCWPGPEPGKFNAGYPLSPTQPVARRSKAAPTTLAQPVHVKSPPPHGSGSTVSQVCLESKSESHHTTQPSFLPQKKY